jgi:succinate dehydrogenase / fumarate reductase flavoprotein subunit
MSDVSADLAEVEYKEVDVLIIGTGGTGIRAAIAAAEQNVSVALVSKSLLGKAHTVMAEGGVAASYGNVIPDDNWEVHIMAIGD